VHEMNLEARDFRSVLLEAATNTHRISALRDCQHEPVNTDLFKVACSAVQLYGPTHSSRIAASAECGIPYDQLPPANSFAAGRRVKRASDIVRVTSAGGIAISNGWTLYCTGDAKAGLVAMRQRRVCAKRTIAGKGW
jgi:hypothetical protein